MQIAVLGTGRVGGSLGKALAHKGYTVMFGTRNPMSDKVQTILEEIAGNASAASIGEAVEFGEAVVIATPSSAIAEVIQEGGDWSGKIIIDATNRIGVNSPTSVAEEIAEQAGGAQVVKAFNTIGAEHYSQPDFSGQTASMFICGDDAAAKTIVGEIVTTLGFELVDAGSLQNARLLESLAALWVFMARSSGDRDIAFRLIHK